MCNPLKYRRKYGVYSTVYIASVGGKLILYTSLHNIKTSTVLGVALLMHNAITISVSIRA